MKSASIHRIVLVTGGGGFLGNAIVRLLVSRGETVRNFSRNYYPALCQLGVEQIQGDLADSRAVEKACQGVEAIFHVAARPGIWGRYKDYYQANVIGTENIIAACKACNVSRLVYTSSPSVIFNGNDMENVNESVAYPKTYYAHYPKTKALAEQKIIQAARQKNLAAIVLRPHLIWGPGDNHLVPRLLTRAHKLRRVGRGDKLVDTIYIDNAAWAHVLAEEKLKADPSLNGRIYFISQDDPIPLWRMVDLILAAGGKPPVQGNISPVIAWIIGAVCEGIYKVLRLSREPPMTRFVARELATAHWFDISAAKNDLGYTPLVSTNEGLKRLRQWL